MPLNQALLAEFDQEMPKTRKTLERVPDGRFDWRPHPKSGTMGWLASHLAYLQGWAAETINNESLDIAPGGKQMQQQPVANRQELLALFDKNVTAARAALAGASDEQLMKPWSLLRNGAAIFTMPRFAVLRGMVMNHIIHHRAQLGVYLRLNDIPVPAIYGPSADEGAM